MSTDTRIREAALRLFAVKGFAATGIREIADAVGISSAALYHHMGTKEQLLYRIARDANRQLLDTAARAAGAVERPEEQLAALVMVHVLAHAENQRAALVVDNELRALSPALRDEVVAIRDEYESLWRATLTNGVAEGIFFVLDEHAARLALIEMCTGVAHWYSPDGPATIEEIAVRFADMALGLVRARRGRRRLVIEDVRGLDVGALRAEIMRQATAAHA